MGAFGLVWYEIFNIIAIAVAKLTDVVQFGKGSVDWPSRGGQENHEAFQYTRSLQAHLSGAQTLETSPT